MDKGMNLLEMMKEFYEANYIWVLGGGVLLAIILAIVALCLSGRKNRNSHIRVLEIEKRKETPLEEASLEETPLNKENDQEMESPETEKSQEGLKEDQNEKADEADSDSLVETAVEGKLSDENEEKPEEISLEETGDFIKEKDLIGEIGLQLDDLKREELALNNPIEEINDKLYHIKIEHANLLIDKVDNIEKLEKSLMCKEKLSKKADDIFGITDPEKEVDILGDENPQDVIMEKINLVKVGRSKKFGPDNLNVSRTGRIFSEEELETQIRE